MAPNNNYSTYKLEKKRQQSYHSTTTLLNQLFPVPGPDGSPFSPTPTPAVCLVNLGYGGVGGTDPVQLDGFMKHFSGFRSSSLPNGKPFSLVLFDSATNAEFFKEQLQGKPCEELGGKHLFLEFVLDEVASVFFRTPEGCTTLPPGLTYIEDFLTVAEESAVLEQVHRITDWEKVKNRQVKHFGWEFDYAKNHTGLQLDHSFPSYLQPLLDRVYELQPGMDPMNQLTISYYPIGSGIPPHCDSHTAFHDTVLIFSLASPVMMEFRKGANRIESIELRPRSLVIMQGEARYGWQHAIRLRHADLLPSGQLLERQPRVSLTLRKVQTDPACSCPFPHLCDGQLPTSSTA